MRPREQVLSDYRSVLTSVYRPADYFARVRRIRQTSEKNVASSRDNVRVDEGADAELP